MNDKRKNKRISFRLDDELHEFLLKICKKDWKSISQKMTEYIVQDYNQYKETHGTKEKK